MPTVIDRLADAQTSREVLEVLNTISTPNKVEDSINFSTNYSSAGVTFSDHTVNDTVIL